MATIDAALSSSGVGSLAAAGSSLADVVFTSEGAADLSAVAPPVDTDVTSEGNSAFTAVSSSLVDAALDASSSPTVSFVADSDEDDEEPQQLILPGAPTPPYKYPAIPEPGATIEGLTATVRAMKEAIELLVGTRAGGAGRAVRPAEVASVIGIPPRDFGNAVDGDFSILDRAIELVEETQEELNAAQQVAIADFQDLLSQEAGARITADEAIDVRVESHTSQISENTAAIVSEAATRATTDTALAGQIDSLYATVGGNTAAISQEAITRATEDEALATTITAVSAIAGRKRTFVQSTAPTSPPTPEEPPLGEGDLWIDTANGNLTKVWDGAQWVAYDDNRIGANEARITSEEIARATADTALAGTIASVTAQVAETTAAVFTEVTTRADADVALAASVTSVTAGSGVGTATGFYRLLAIAPTMGDVAAEFAVQVRAAETGPGSTYASAGFRVQALSNGNSRILFEANQFIVDVDGYTPFTIVDNDVRWGGTIHGNSIVANTIESSRLVVGSYMENLVLNGDFQENGEAWAEQVSGTGTVTYGNNGAYGRAAVLTRGTGQALITSEEQFRVDPGSIYELSAFLSGNVGTTTGVYFVVQFFNSSGSFIAEEPVIDDGAITSSTVLYQGQITAPSSAATAVVVVQLTSGATSTSMLVSKVRLRQTAGATLIQDGAITTDKVFANAITAAKIAANTITAAQIAAGTITATQIAAGTITAAQIAALTITAAQIAANTITASQIATNTITATEIAASAITSSELAANAVIAGKIAAGTIVAADIAAGAITASKLLVGSHLENLIINGDFSETTTGWTAGVTGTGAVTTSTHDPLGPIVVLTRGTGTAEVTSGFVRVEAGRKYEVSAFIQGSGNSAAGGFLVAQFYDSAQAFISSDSSALNNGAFTTTMTRYQAQVSAPATAAYARVRVLHHSTSTVTSLSATSVRFRLSTGTTLIEDDAITTGKINALAVTAAKIAANTITAAQIAAGTITATQIAASTITASQIASNTITATQIAADAITSSELAAGAVIAGKIAAGTIVADDIAAGAITASKIAISSSLENMVPNGDFEEILTGWTSSAPGGGSVSTGNNNPHGRAAILTRGSGQSAEILSNFILVEPGAKYEVSAQLSGDSASAAGATITVQFYDNSQVFIGGSTVNVYSSGALTTTSTRRAALITANTSAVYAKVRIIHTSASSATIMYVNKVRFRLSAGTTLIEDDAITTGKIAALQITAAKIAANAVETAKINAGAITATHVGSNEIIANTANIANLMVGTLKLINETVTVPSSWGTGSLVDLSGSLTEYEDMDLTFTSTNGATVVISVMGAFEIDNDDAGNAVINYEVQINNVAVQSGTNIVIPPSGSGPTMIIIATGGTITATGSSQTIPVELHARRVSGTNVDIRPLATVAVAYKK